MNYFLREFILFVRAFSQWRRVSNGRCGWYYGWVLIHNGLIILLLYMLLLLRGLLNYTRTMPVCDNRSCASTAVGVVVLGSALFGRGVISAQRQAFALHLMDVCFMRLKAEILGQIKITFCLFRLMVPLHGFRGGKRKGIVLICLSCEWSPHILVP